MCESELPVMSDIFEVYDFENEQHWLKGRTNGIGGSDASAVVGMNTWKLEQDRKVLFLYIKIRKSCT